MAIQENKLAKIQIAYESGKFTKSDICKKHRISRPTLNKHAKENGWTFQGNFTEVNDQIQQKSLERLIEKEVDKISIENDKFHKAVSSIEDLALSYIKELREAKKAKQDEKLTKDEADRIFSFLKSCKISSEIMNMNYNGKRKMLGMDKDDDIEKARKIKHADRQQTPDPTEGMDRSQVQARIKELSE